MTDIQRLMTTLKARMDAIVEPELPNFDVHLACKKQDARMDYFQDGAINAAAPDAGGAIRQHRHRLIEKLIANRLLAYGRGTERNRTVTFTERGRQYSEHLLDGADMDVLFLFLNDLAAAIDETPAHVAFMGREWIPWWMAYGLPEWGYGGQPWREMTPTVAANGFLDFTSMIGRNWIESATDAHGQVFYAVTDDARAALEEDTIPERCQFKPIAEQTKCDVARLHKREKQQELDRIRNTATNEVYIGMPIGNWSRDAVQWIRPHYWKWRQLRYKPQCSECAAIWDKPRSKLTCSPRCKKKRAKRLQELAKAVA